MSSSLARATLFPRIISARSANTLASEIPPASRIAVCDSSTMILLRLRVTESTSVLSLVCAPIQLIWVPGFTRLPSNNGEVELVAVTRISFWSTFSTLCVTIIGMFYSFSRDLRYSDFLSAEGLVSTILLISLTEHIASNWKRDW